MPFDREPKPGEFHDEFGNEIPSRPSSLEVRLEARRREIAALLSEDRIKTALPTEDLRKSLRSIKAQTMSGGIAAGEKKLLVLETWERKLIDSEVLKKFPTVYIGAGVDVEYPLTLGSRSIIMVDPTFLEERYRNEVRDKIKKIAHEGQVKESGNNFTFTFDFGQGAEEVTVNLDPTVYMNEKTRTEIERRDKEIGVESKLPPSFVSPREVGMFLVFQGEDPSSDTEAFRHLVSGGYVVSNRMLDQFVKDSGLFKGESFNELSDEDQRRGVNDVYEAKGLESISIENESGSYYYTFARKK